MEEIKDDMFFYIQIFQDMKGESASAEQFEDWIHNMGEGWTSADTMCYFVFHIYLMAFFKLKTTNGDVMWSTFRPVGEQHLLIPVEEQHVKQTFINASDLLLCHYILLIWRKSLRVIKLLDEQKHKSSSKKLNDACIAMSTIKQNSIMK
jgi:hypothetical protein